MSLELTKSFNPDTATVPETPYMQARQEWDERIGSNVIQAKNWRLTSLGLLTLNLILTIALISFAMSNKHIPYIIEVGNGIVKNITKLNKSSSYIPTEKALQHHLTKFIEKIRSRSQDNAVNRKWIYEAYALLTTKTANKLDEYFGSQQNIKFDNESTTLANVISFTKVTNNTYQLQWIEETHSKDGKLIDSSKWVGFVTIKIAPPTSEKSILQNPLGIWLTDFSWSQAKGAT